MDKIDTLVELQSKLPSIKNTNTIHRSRLSKLDKLALFVTTKVGSVGFLFACIILVAIPLIFHSALSVVQYISSGFLQLVLLPLIMIGQNLQGRHAELRAQHDYDTNLTAEKEIETILLHLERQDKMIQEIVNILKSEVKTNNTLSLKGKALVAK